MSTFSAKPGQVKSDWYVVDASDKVLGRLASVVAFRLRGKHKPEYTPHVDTGDHIIIVNAEKIKVTGNKFNDKMYHHHSGYIGGLKSVPFAKMLAKDPTKVLMIAIRGMLPKNSLGRAMLKKVRIYSGSEHEHIAQQPIPLEIEEA